MHRHALCWRVPRRFVASLYDLIKEFKKTKTATATGTSLNKRFNEQNSGCSSIINLGQFLRVLSKKQYTRKVWSRGKQLVLFSRES